MHNQDMRDRDEAVESDDVVYLWCDVPAYIPEYDHAVWDGEVEELLGDAAGVGACYWWVLVFGWGEGRGSTY